MEYRKGNHCIYLCDYHIVMTTKYRRKIFNEGLFEYVRRKLFTVAEFYPTLYIKEVNHDKDHVHMLISIPPSKSVGEVVKLLKTNSSRGIKQKFPYLREVYWGSDGIWSDGYFVSTVGVNDAVIRRYIQQQGADDMAQTTQLFETN